jgi:hypothetical protein
MSDIIVNGYAPMGGNQWRCTCGEHKAGYESLTDAAIAADNHLDTHEEA